MVKLTDYHVKQIRTQGLVDSYWGRRLGVDDTTVRHARIGKTYQHVETPPDVAPRDGTGRSRSPKAKPTRIRREWV
jgi:hypothetical protein